MLAGCLKLKSCPFGETVDAELLEQFVGSSQLGACVEPPTFAPKPFAIEKMCPSELDANGCAPESFDRFLVKSICVIALFEQRSTARFNPERPISSRSASCLRKELEGGTGALGLSAANCGLDQLSQRPNRRAFRNELLGMSDSGKSIVIAAETVVERPAEKLGNGQGESLSPPGGIVDLGANTPKESVPIS